MLECASSILVESPTTVDQIQMQVPCASHALHIVTYNLSCTFFSTRLFHLALISLLLHITTALFPCRLRGLPPTSLRFTSLPFTSLHSVEPPMQPARTGAVHSRPFSSILVHARCILVHARAFSCSFHAYPSNHVAYHMKKAMSTTSE